VKVLSFGRPLGVEDLEQLARELDVRAGEPRPITLVCLASTLEARAWIEQWNQLRQSRSAPHHVELIELRTDERYGPLLAHQPPSARIDVRREGTDVRIEVADFVSPALLERVRQQTGRLAAITDWRAMVDSVSIDANHDGQVFRATLADVPVDRRAVVAGVYTLPAQGERVAVKIVDLLGEEVLSVHAP
jgi:hypothetical protein